QRAPPLLPPSECCDWRGVCKNGLQNLELQRVRGQNLEKKRVRAWLATSACTASALAMICRLNSRVKVGCHIGLLENPRASLARNPDLRKLGSPGRLTDNIQDASTSVKACSRHPSWNSPK